MDKEAKKKLQDLRNMLTYQYSHIVTLLKGGHIKLSDIDVFVNDYPDITTILAERRKKEEEAQKRLHYKEVVNMMRPSAEKYLEQLKEELSLVSEEYNKTLLSEAVTQKDIQHKNNRLSRLQTKLADIEKTIYSLQNVLAEQQPKRKVGRPKKNIQEVDNEDIE